MIYSPFTRKLDFGFEYSDGNLRYLKLDGSNANTDINIGSYGFSTTGTLSSGTTTVDSLTTDVGGITILGGQSIKPSVNSTSAISIAQSDGTKFFEWDSTKKHVLMTSTPTASDEKHFEIYSTVSQAGDTSNYNRAMFVLNSNNNRHLYLGVDTYSSSVIWGSANLGLGVNGYNSLHKDIIYMTAGKLELNKWQENCDVTIHGDTLADVFYMDASTNRVGIGIAAPKSLLHVNGDVTLLAGSVIRPSADSTTAINIAKADGTKFVTFDTTNKHVGIGATANAGYTLGVSETFTHTSGSKYAGRFLAEWNGASDSAFGTTAGLYGGAYSLGTKNLRSLFGLYFDVGQNGSGTVANMIAQAVSCSFQAGAVTSASCISASVIGDPGFIGTGSTIGTLYGVNVSFDYTLCNITTAYGLSITTPLTADSGSITNLYGIYINDQNVGGTLNYAIYTNAGDVRFGDDVFLRSDTNEYYVGAGDDMSIGYTGTIGEIKTDLVAPSDLHIDCGTDKTIVLNETVYDDVQFVTSTGKVPSANYPTWEAFTTNTEMYAFSVDDKLQLEANEPMHGWKEGTVGNAHIHFALKTAQNTGADRFVKFELIFAYSDYNGTWTEQAAMTQEQTIPTGSGALKSFLTAFSTTVTLTGLHIGSQITCRVRRIAATGGTEYADDVYITQVGVHLEQDTIGSRQVGTK